MRAAIACLFLLALVGCASHTRHGPPGVPVDSRPSPPVPPEPTPEPAPGATTGGGRNVETDPPPPMPVGTVMSPEERRATLQRIVADTTAAGAAVRKCGRRELLPDQESVMETTKSLLAQARTALARDEVWRAESLARKARQLAASLNCPG
jgi:hypothetical protein